MSVVGTSKINVNLSPNFRIVNTLNRQVVAIKWFRNDGFFLSDTCQFLIGINSQRNITNASLL